MPKQHPALLLGAALIVSLAFTAFVLIAPGDPVAWPSSQDVHRKILGGLLTFISLGFFTTAFAKWCEDEHPTWAFLATAVISAFPLLATIF
jgi:drug/metabolite transporter (DMT)-like permease